MLSLQPASLQHAAQPLPLAQQVVPRVQPSK
jgi:hypothetical protein